MSKKVKVTLNYKGIGELLKSREMAQLVEGKAKEISDRCGEGYSHDMKVMGTRVIASAYTQTFEAMKDNLENNTLLKNKY